LEEEESGNPRAKVLPFQAGNYFLGLFPKTSPLGSKANSERKEFEVIHGKMLAGLDFAPKNIPPLKR
jgi:hypothetical protein